jgi:hypothetical protein
MKTMTMKQEMASLTLIKNVAFSKTGLEISLQIYEVTRTKKTALLVLIWQKKDSWGSLELKTT